MMYIVYVINEKNNNKYLKNVSIICTKMLIKTMKMQ